MSKPGNQEPDDMIDAEIENEEIALHDLPEIDEKESDILQPPVETVSEQSEGNDFQIGTVSEGDLDATRLYLGEIGFSPLLTAEEEVYYARRYRLGDSVARKRMIESNLRLVVKIAR